MPRGGLSRERVLDEAQAIADRDGLPALTLTTLAEVCGVRKPSLYKHIDGLPAIHVGLAARALRRLHRIFRDADPAEGLAGVARQWRDFGRAHPGLYAAANPSHVSPPPEVQALATEALAALLVQVREAGVPWVRAEHAARGLRALVHGFVTLEDAGGFGLVDAVDDSFEQALAALVAGLCAPAAKPVIKEVRSTSPRVRLR